MREVASEIVQLSPLQRLALCASCAERLMPFYEDFWIRKAEQQPPLLRTALDRIWEFLQGTNDGMLEADEFRREAEKAIPDEDDVADRPYAQDAALAVTYALDAWLTNRVESVLQCLEQCYNVVDNYALRQIIPDGVISENTEAVILQHPIVQAEIARQLRELDLVRHATRPEWISTMKQLRKDAIETQVLIIRQTPYADPQ